MKSSDKKIYVAFKPCKKPNLLIQWNGFGGKDPKYINATQEHGIGYFEDDIGYYHICGEMICSMD